MLVTLPNGLIDGYDCFDHVLIDELKGSTQNYLVNSALVINNIGHIPKILGDMILSFQTKEGMPWKGKISDAIELIPSGDIETILIKLRENTYGPKFHHEAVCSHCGNHHKNLVLNLSELTLTKLSHEDMIKSKAVLLPKSQKTIELRPQYMKDLFYALKIGTDKQDQLITESITLSVKSIDNNTNITSEDIGKLPWTDLLFLNDAMTDMKIEGTIDTTIDIDCVSCKKEFQVRLNPLKADFFSPTGASMSMNI